MRGWMEFLDFVLLDEVCLFLSILLGSAISEATGRPIIDNNITIFYAVALLSDFLIIVSHGTMDGVLHRNYYEEFKQTAMHVFLVVSVFAILEFLRRETLDLPRVFAILAIIFYFLSSSGIRTLWKQIRRSLPKKTRRRQSLLVVTDEQWAPEILAHMARFSFDRYQVTGLVLTNRNAKWDVLQGVPVVANVDDAADYLCRTWTDEVLFFRVNLDETYQELLKKCQEMAVTVHLYVSLRGIGQHKRIMERIGGYDVLTTNINMMTAGDALLKRGFDVVCGFFGSLAALLVMLIFAPLIKIASPGPVIFKQERIGENGRRFFMYKLRSMYPDADRRKAELQAENDHADGMMFKMEFDPRVIGNRILPDGTRKRGIGEFIRKTSLDEMPQFFNVLRGDMSMVGTRPPTPDEWARYQYHHRARMAMRPGLTGMWQIHPDKDSMDFNQVVQLDTAYISGWRPGLDISIIFRTARLVIRRIIRGGKPEEAGKRRGLRRRPTGPLRIAIIGHRHFPAFKNVFEKDVEEQAVRLAARGHTVVVYNRRQEAIPDMKEYEGARIVRVPALSGGAGIILYSFLSTMKAVFGRYDLISYMGSGACAMIPLAHLFGLRCVAQINGLDSRRGKWGPLTQKFLAYGEKCAARKADVCLVPSEAIRENIRRRWGMTTIRYANGVERPDILPAEAIRETWNLRKDSYLLYLGRLEPEKGLYELISAFRSVQTEKKLVIAGEASNPEYYDQLRRIAGGDDRISFSGLVSGQIKEELFSNAYTFVLPSTVEGISYTLLEALSYGNCCLISDIPENTELAGGCAVVFRKSNIAALQRNLQALLDEPARVDALRERAADYVTGRYRWDWAIEHLERVYRGETRDYEEIRREMAEKESRTAAEEAMP